MSRSGWPPPLRTANDRSGDCPSTGVSGAGKADASFAHEFHLLMDARAPEAPESGNLFGSGERGSISLKPIKQTPEQLKAAADKRYGQNVREWFRRLFFKESPILGRF